MYYCYTVEQERLTFLEHLNTHPRFFVGFVLLNLQIPMQWFVDRWLSFSSFCVVIVMFVLLPFAASDYIFGYLQTFLCNDKNTYQYLIFFCCNLNTTVLIVLTYFVENILTSFHKRNSLQQNTDRHSIASYEYNTYLHSLTRDVHQVPQAPMPYIQTSCLMKPTAMSPQQHHLDHLTSNVLLC